MNKRREGLQRERDKLYNEVVNLQQKLEEAIEVQEDFEQKNLEANKKIAELTARIDVLKILKSISV